MLVGGLRKLSLIDYPGKLSAVVFTQGCNFRCSYCHNAELVVPDLFTDPIPPEDVLSFLAGRRGRIEGVVLTGGEPLQQSDLADFLSDVRAMGYAVKLDTNGSYPDRLQVLLSKGMLDYIAMDYKAPSGKYALVGGQGADACSIKRTLAVITQSGLPYEVRTTLFRGMTKEDIVQMMEELKNAGVKNYYLQMTCDDYHGRFAGLTESELISLFKQHCEEFHICGIRNTYADNRKESLTMGRW